MVIIFVFVLVLVTKIALVDLYIGCPLVWKTWKCKRI